jgi:hypothetical protein
LTRSLSLFRLYYHPIDCDPMTRLFCRRPTGGLRCAVGLAAGEAARVRHVRGSLEGNAFCEWQLEWPVPRA